MPLPDLDDLVDWHGTTYRVVGIITEPALIIEDANGYRQTVGASTVRGTR